MKRMWCRVAKTIGDVYQFGPLWIIVHDDGLSVAWKQVEVFDWKVK